MASVAGLRLTYVLKRLVIELPFLAFALFLPIVGRGEQVEVLGLSLSVSGLWAAWNIVVKGTLGVAASIVLASTTTVSELLRGLDRLRLPRVLTGIMSFMIRYGDVIADEMHRMRVARIARGHDPRWIWQVRAVASSAGALFIRSFERGERVHVAMLARGYDGVLPVVDDETGAPAQLADRLGTARRSHRRGRRRVDGAMSAPLLQVEGAGLRLPRRPPGALRRRPDRARG